MVKINFLDEIFKTFCIILIILIFYFRKGGSMQCDICGKETRVFLADLEGAEVHVCSNCNPTGEGKKRTVYNSPETKSKFGPQKFVRQQAPVFRERKEEPFDLTNYEIVQNYAELIKQEREKRKLTIEDFARELRTQSSFSHSVEQGKLKPNNNLLLKLFEKFGLVLVQKKENTINEKPERFVRPPLKQNNNNDFQKNNFNRNNFYPRTEFKREFRKEEKFEPVVFKPEIETPQKELEAVEMNHKKKLVL